MKKVILFQGDSITDCLRDRNDDTKFGDGYPNLVKTSLGVDHPNDYIFYNRGCGGDRITDLYTRINCHAINLKPDYMSVLVGVNDIWHGLAWGNGTGFERYEKIYNMYVEEIKAEFPNIKIMIMEPFVLKGENTVRDDDPSYWKRMNEGVRRNAQIAQAVAQKQNVKFVELQKLFDEAAKEREDIYWLSDGVHPTAEGHELIKREWLKAFEEIK